MNRRPLIIGSALGLLCWAGIVAVALLVHRAGGAW